jgi:hypothetical protein
LRWINLSRYGRVVKCERPESAQAQRQTHRSRGSANHPLRPFVSQKARHPTSQLAISCLDVRARSGQRWATNREACRRSGVVGCDITGPPPNRCSRPKQLVCCARDGRLWARGSQASRMRDQTALNAHCVHEAVGSIRLSICSGLSGALLAPEPSEAFEWESGGSLRGIGHDRRLAEP